MKPRWACRRAFTMVEALVALAIMGVAAGALLLGVDSALQESYDSVERTIGVGIARQLMDEVAGMKYMDSATPYQTPLSPSATELAVGNRNAFNDIDDFVSYTRQPPVDPWNVTLGTDNGQGDERDPSFFAHSGYLTRWKETIDVYYVSAADLSQRLSSGQTSDFRAVEVRVFVVDPQRGDREVARLRRVFAYVPPTL